MKPLFLALLLSAAVWGGQSASVTSAGGSGYIYVTLPNSAPWTTILAPQGTNVPMRWEVRFHDFHGAPSSYSYLTIGPMKFGTGTPDDGTTMGFNPNDGGYGDSATRGTSAACVPNCTDVIVRAQRDVVNMRYTVEIFDVQTGAVSALETSTITGFAASPSWGNRNILIRRDYKIAYFRWFSTIVPTGTIPSIAEQGDIANWDFDGSPVDSVNGLSLSSASGDAVLGYVATTSYPPSCNAGLVQTFRAGYGGQLDGSGSRPLDGGATLAYFWQNTAGPSRLVWSSHTTQKPTISGEVFGQYDFQLTVTDGSGQSTPCNVSHGAVATDNDGIVITNNSVFDRIIGPLIRLGKSPWPWFDDRTVAAADVRINYMDTDYPDYWSAINEGTVSVNRYDTSVIGVGTHFLSTICNADGSLNGATGIVIHYPHSDGQGDGYDRWPATGCVSDTELTLASQYHQYDTTVPSSISNVHWGDDRGRGWWEYNGAPPNYYDNVLAFYALYYRSGLTKYLTAARKLADRFWMCPEMDRGRGQVFGASLSRATSIIGLYARSVDNPPASMVAGLHRLIDGFWVYFSNDPGSPGFDYDWGWGGLWDLREVAYHLNVAAICALVDTDATYKSKCRGWLGQALPNIFQPKQQADGGWGTIYPRTNSWDASTSVTLTHGSTTVTGVGTSWASGSFPSYIWFIDNPATFPMSVTAGDPVGYYVTWVSGTELTLDRAYEGTTGTHGYQYHNESVGYTISPFMEGILSIGFDLAAKALATDDPTNSALAAQFHLDTANWLRTIGYNPASQGMWYFVGPFMQSANAIARYPGGLDYNTEPMLATMRAYQRTSDVTHLNFVKTMFNNYWAKPLTCPVGSTFCFENAGYQSDWNDNGWRMVEPNVESGRGSKLLGMVWGYPAAATIPALILGGGAPLVSRHIDVGFKLTNVLNAAKFRVTVTSPEATATTTTCTSSPCIVSWTGQPGKVLLTPQYLSAGDAVLATGTTIGPL